MSAEATLAALDQAQVSIPLNRAMLCLDCDRISEISRTGCPTCGTEKGLVPMASWLDRLVTCAAGQTSAQARA